MLLPCPNILPNIKKTLYPFVFPQPCSAAAFPTFQIEMLEIAFLTPQTLCAVVFASPAVHREMFFWSPILFLFFWVSQPPPTRQRKPHFLDIRNEIKALESDKKLLQQQVTALA